MIIKRTMQPYFFALTVLWTVAGHSMQVPPSMNQILVVSGYPKPEKVRRYGYELRYRVLLDPVAAKKLGIIRWLPQEAITKVVEIQSVKCMPNGTPCLYMVLYYKGAKGSEFVDAVAYRHDPSYTLPQEDSGVYVTMENMFDDFKKDFLAVYNGTKKK